MRDKGFIIGRNM